MRGGGSKMWSETPYVICGRSQTKQISKPTVSEQELRMRTTLRENMIYSWETHLTTLLI